jgi:bifunctional non-homologous end joining protein LigD
LSDEIPTGPSSVHELKWDGYRIIAQRREGAVRLWSRNARNWAPSFPRIFEAMTRDAEAAVEIWGEAGRS